MKQLAVCGCLALIAALIARPQEAVFHVESRIVEVYATVLDQHGRYVEGLTKESFQVTDNDQPQPLVGFDSSAVNLSCAILMDTTASMRKSLPAVKNAIGDLVNEFRDQDAVALYGFSTSLDLLQEFTLDKAAAKRAAMLTRAGGSTALFDALARVTLDIETRPGKKAVIVFTDGDDNASVLNFQRATDQAKKSAIPLYTVAQGDARHEQQLTERLKEIARLTGGKTYSVRTPHETENIFRDIADELQHEYRLSYKPPESKGDAWRRVRVTLRGAREYKDYTVRSKEGYFPR